MGSLRSAPPAATLVDIVREFLLVHGSLRRLAEHFRDGSLRFEAVQTLVSDGEGSLLFRLKERCHALFRQAAAGSPVGREALFDLAVGALFHEAMKLRESLYQQSVYGAKVRALRQVAGEEQRDGLFDAFASILDAGASRLEETFQEVETLLYETRQQLLGLLTAHFEDGFVTRYLIEHPALLEEVFEMPADELLAEVHGDSGQAYARAARCYLESGCFDRATVALDEAAGRLARSPDLSRLQAYADGMQAYLEGHYDACVEKLGAWLEGGVLEGEAGFANLAGSALSQLGRLAGRDGSDPVAAAAAALALRLTPQAGVAR